MKRWFALLLVVLLSIVPIFIANMESLDWSQYATDELLVFQNDIAKEISERKQSEAGTDVESTQYPPGQYKIGTDIPEGEYFAIADPDSFLSSITVKDGAGSDAKTVLFSVFTTHSIVGVREGEYMTVVGASLISMDASIAYVNSIIGETIPEGMYLVGFHFSPGEFKTFEDKDAMLASITTYADPYQDKVLDIIFVDGSGYIDMKDGEYVLLNGAYLEAKG